MTVKRPDDGEREGVWVAALGGETHHPGEWPLAAMELNNGGSSCTSPTTESSGSSRTCGSTRRTRDE